MPRRTAPVIDFAKDTSKITPQPWGQRNPRYVAEFGNWAHSATVSKF